MTAELDEFEHSELVPLPRVPFIPEVIWVDDPVGSGGLVAVSASTDRARWDEEVLSDRPVVIQVDDGQIPVGEVGWRPSSSCSQPSLVAAMLYELDVRPGDRVLEIGTGTGWNAALLAVRTGPGGSVVSVEVDDALATTARRVLAEVGSLVRVVDGDGMAGYPEGAPYDRIISTASVRRLSTSWLDQARPGATIVTPWGSDFCSGALLRLTALRDRAVGRCGMGLGFMRVRSQRRNFLNPGADELRTAERSTSERPIREIVDIVTRERAAFAIGLRVPWCYLTIEDIDDDRRIEFHDTNSRSWACVTLTPGSGTHDVVQSGPRRLWAEVEAAYSWWHAAGRPTIDRFGLTLGSDGEHTVWLDDPDRGPRWSLASTSTPQESDHAP